MPGIPAASSAVRADEAWRSLIASAKGGAVRAVVETAFAHAVNLEVDGARFALLAAGGRPAPGALLTRRRDFVGVRAGTDVEIRSELGGATVIEFEDRDLPGGRLELGAIEFFDSRLDAVAGMDPFGEGEPPYSIDPPGARSLDAGTIAELLAQVAHPGSFVRSPDEPPFSRAVGARLASAREHFRVALTATLRDPAAPSQFPAAVRSLIGLGVGLTPSGDDYLVGALAALTAHPAPSAAPAREALASAIRDAVHGSDGAERTTAVSRHFLLAAADRAFHLDLADAARSLNAADARATAAAFAATAAIGSTSGTDALHGLTDAHAAFEKTSVDDRARVAVRANAPDPTARPRAGTRPARTESGVHMTENQWPESVATATADDIRAAIAAGADVNATATTEQQRSSAVLIAARARNFEAFDALVEAGADVDAQNRINLNPLLWACINDDIDVARRAVEAGADLDRKTRFDGVGIHPAAEKGYVELTRYLATLPDMNVNYTNLCGWTPLLEAVILRDGGPAQQEIVKILLDAGADPKMVDQWGVSPLQHAEKLGFAEIAQLLKAAGA